MAANQVTICTTSEQFFLTASVFAAQEQALQTKYVKFHIDKTSDSPLKP